MNIQEGIFCSYIRAFPQEMERMFEAIEYVVEQGIGGAILDSLTPKTFRDTKMEYFNRLKKEALKQEDGLILIFKALLSWYETWNHLFLDFNSKNAKTKFSELPIHTWLHCLLSGQQHLYQTLADQELVLVNKSEWDEIKSKAEKVFSLPARKDESAKNTEKMTRLLKLYENDVEVRLKETIMDKKLAVFHEGLWDEEELEAWRRKYNLLAIKQFSSIDLTSDPGKYDYYLFLTSQASHAARDKLGKNISKNKLFLIKSSNKEIVMADFFKQLRGKLT